ncbi:class I adenylate-forming enzyme family protein [Mycobacterium sp.]|uniref:class I adenylate-forming enzyme family protein n=1 Tax=Mycobacterium sp. TaxID=1785 RepID=UPI003F995F31
MTGVVEISRTHNPFTRDGIRIDENAVPHYVDLPESLFALLRSKVEAAPEVEAVVEVDSERLTYRQRWDRAARVAGGLRARGVDRGDRVAVRYRAGTDWVLAFWGTLMAGGIAVAVNTGRSASRSTSCRPSGPRGRPYGWGITVGVDGWLHTGDIVRVDDAGRVHMVDRIKDIIIRGGENVSSIEVESALLAAPGVAEAAVIAVPDDVMGEKVGAVLFGGAETVDVQQVLAHCRQQLADFKIPQYIVVSGRPLPRNPGGKLLKAQLRKSVEWGAPL